MCASSPISHRQKSLKKWKLQKSCSARASSQKMATANLASSSQKRPLHDANPSLAHITAESQKSLTTAKQALSSRNATRTPWHKNSISCSQIISSDATWAWPRAKKWKTNTDTKTASMPSKNTTTKSLPSSNTLKQCPLQNINSSYR